MGPQAIHSKRRWSNHLGHLTGNPYRCCRSPEVLVQVGFEEMFPFDLPEALDKGEGFVKDRIVLSGVGDTAFRQSLVEDQDLQASR